MPQHKRKRIAVVVPSILNTGGVASVAEFVIRTIRERTDHDLKVVSLAMAARDRDSVRLTNPLTWLGGAKTSVGDFRGTPFTHVGAIFPELEDRRYLPRARLAQLMSDCDMVQVVSGVPAWANPVLGLGIPVSLQVATLIDVERRRLDPLHRGPVGRWRRRMTRRIRALDDHVLRNVDAVQVENNWMLEHCRAQCTKSGVDLRLAAPGVDSDRFHPLEDRPELPGYILSVGRMADPRKRHMLLLEAYGLLTKRMDPAPRLALAGPDEPTREFETRARELGVRDRIDIHTFPEKSELTRIYRGATAFALASDEEGFGVTVVEAMASGTPPVSTRSGGPDDIIDDGQDGFLVDRDDAEALADRLMRVTSDPELNRRLSDNARQKVDARYSEKSAASAFVQAFDRLLRNNRMSA